jgi:hypothetical protein
LAAGPARCAAESNRPQKGTTMHHDREHVISVVLTHEDWQEFVRLQPQPAAWLRERIQEMITASRPEDAPMPAAAEVCFAE